MLEEEKKKESGEVTRREFLKDAGFLVGGAAIGAGIAYPLIPGTEKEVVVEVSKYVCPDCSEEFASLSVLTSHVETEHPAEVEVITKYVCPYDSQEFASLAALTAHIETAHPGEVEVITKYVCPHCSEELATLAALVAHVEAEHPAKVDPAVANVVKFTVNGHEYELQVGPADTLREVLREKLGLTSIKDMCCGQGACGSCSAIVDGRPILTCMALAIEFDGAVIETAEGIYEANHPLIEAYVKNYCMQCGYCTPGFVVTAKALLDHNSNPTEEEIRDALGGNLCRCGTYTQHIVAVQEAATSLGGG